MELRIGTSGWQYRHWRGPFYPDELAMARWFGYYSERFDTVEVNSGFYHLPAESTFGKWRDAAPEGFRYAVKGNRFVTHLKKLRDCGESIDLFYSRAGLLEDRLGPVLWQLPPTLGCDLERLSDLLSHTPAGVPVAVEPRHPSWAAEPVWPLLTGQGAAWCLGDTPKWSYTDALLDPECLSASGLRLGELLERALAECPFLYLRLHGHRALYDTDYTDEELGAWARYIRRWTDSGRDAWVYFDNDGHGYAPANARRLRTLIRGDPT